MKIFSFFLDNPSYEFYENEIRKKIKIAKGSSIKWLKVLVEENLIVKKTKGRLNLYKLNSENPVVRELKKIKLISQIIPEFKKIENVEIYLYGSSVRGEDKENSDVDILVLGKRSNDLLDILRKIEKKINRRVVASFYTQLEWSRMARKDPTFYERVEKDKFRLA